MNLRHFVAAAALAAVSAASLAQTSPAPAPAPTPAPAPAADPVTTARGTSTPLINKHEANQEQRIKQGKQSGELTRHEARRLRAEQKVVDRAQNKAAADGTVTAQERHRIRHMQDRAGKDIRRQKHDAASAPGTGQ
ncbi:MAG TPA: hypothetical protein VJ743_12770 [Albitalea sp.]|nr:hypothetical protein [Albitalea sp.]